MTEEQTAKPSPEPSDDDLAEADRAEEAQEGEEQVDQSPKVKSAADAVRRAEAELEKARGLYEKVRQDATERLRKVRETTVGDAIDGTLQAVRKHPGPGVLLAMAVGFFLGRLFRR